MLNELHPEIREYPVTEGLYGRRILHPLVEVHIDLAQRDPTHFAAINAGFQKMKDLAAESARARDWRRYVVLHNRPFRLKVITDVVQLHGVNFRELWPAVADVWQDSESIWSEEKQWREIWSRKCPRRKFVMETSERQALKKMDDELTIYRGVWHPNFVNGFSWTLNKEKAKWFARQNGCGCADRSPHVFEGRVSKVDVLAYFTGRKENEIVVFPEHVEIERAIRLRRVNFKVPVLTAAQTIVQAHLRSLHLSSDSR